MNWRPQVEDDRAKGYSLCPSIHGVWIEDGAWIHRISPKQLTQPLYEIEINVLLITATDVLSFLSLTFKSHSIIQPYEIRTVILIYLF